MNEVPSAEVQSALSAIDIGFGGDQAGFQLAQYIFEMLYNTMDIQTAVKHLLEIVGRAYNVSRVYIFENSWDGKTCSNTFEWCNTGVEAQMDLLQEIPYDSLKGFRESFDENDIFYCKDITQLSKNLYDILKAQDICSVLQCAIMDDKEFVGYVGFDECRENRAWTKEQIEALTLISKVLSVFLLKQRLKEQLKNERKELEKD